MKGYICITEGIGKTLDENFIKIEAHKDNSMRNSSTVLSEMKYYLSRPDTAFQNC